MITMVVGRVATGCESKVIGGTGDRRIDRNVGRSALG